MKRAFLLSVSFLAVASTFGKTPVNAKSSKPFTHRLGVSALYLHVSDPDWSHMWWRRNIVPSYQFSYKRWGLKTRFFTLGRASLFGSFGNPILETKYATISHLSTESPLTVPDNPITPSGLTSERRYNTLDLILSHSLINQKGHRFDVGTGATYRKGLEVVTDYVFQVSPNFSEGVSHVVDRNQWGAIGELSYSYSFLKHFFASAEASYRVYPHSTGLFTGGIGVGVQFQH